MAVPSGWPEHRPNLLAEPRSPPASRAPNPFASQPTPAPPPVYPRVLGNIDLNIRPVVKNPNGGYSTVLSMSIGTDQGEVLIPQVSDDGRIMTPQEAIDQYRRTGRNLGVFRTPNEATAYAKWLHQQQAARYGLE